MPAEDAVLAVRDWRSRIDDVSMYSDYYEGNHRYKFATEKFLRKYRWVLENARENLCPAVVDSFASKMVIQSWEGAETEGNDAGMSQVFDDLGMDVVVEMTETEALKCADAYVLVWPDGNGTDRPWVKLASQSAVMPDYRIPGELRWYADIWIAADGYGRVNVYYDNQVERFQTKSKLREDTDTLLRGDLITWPEKPDAYLPYSDDDGSDVIAHTYGRVPAVWFPAKARQLNTHGRSILTDVVPLQDMLNKSVADVIVGGEAFAMPLRYLLNWKPKRRMDPATGTVVTPKLEFDPTQKAIFGVEGSGPFGQLDPPDVTRLVNLHKEIKAKIAGVVGLPGFNLSPIEGGEPPTGVALRVLSTRMTDYSRISQKAHGPRWSEVAALLGFPGVRPVWRDPAPVDESEELDNAVTRKAIGYDKETILKRLGEDPDDIQRILEANTAAALPIGGPQLVRSMEAGLSPQDLTG